MKVVSQRVSFGYGLAVAIAGLLGAGPAASQSYADWQFYRAVTIDNTANPEQLNQHQVRVELTSAKFDFADARPDGADLRFVDSDRLTALDHWVEFWSAPAESAVIWVEVPEIPASAAVTVYLLHGNPAAQSASDGEAAFVFFDDFEDFQMGGLNAPDPLVTPTYEGSGQVVHPDVVRVPGGWQGYEYWMAMTPYPDGIDDYENPSILVSHDGLVWMEPPGVSNPLAPEPPGHNDDPDMLLVDGVMMIYYNETNSDGNTYMRLLTSVDGVNWTGPETVFIHSNYIMSPTLLHEGDAFYMWYLHSPVGCSSTYQNVYLRISADGRTWGPEQSVDIEQPGRVVWHFDIVKADGVYRMLYISYLDGSNCGSTSLYHAVSRDRLNWTTDTAPLLTPSESGWDAAQIYRASFLSEDDLLRIWYSARSGTGQWRVGYVEGGLDEFQAANVNKWAEINGQVSATGERVRSGLYGLYEAGASTYPQIFEDMSGRVCFSAWMYDDLGEESGRLNILRMWDPGTADNPRHAVGVGIFTGQSTSNYIFHTEGWSYATTDVARSEGWHRLSIRVHDDVCDLLVDSRVVGVLDVLDEQSVSRVSIEGLTDGPGWFDDAYLRYFSWPEPKALVGPAMSAAVDPGPPAGTGLRLEPNRPNPLNPATEIHFALPDARRVRLSILDLQGHVVRTLVDAVRPAGRHVISWDGRDDRATPVASGTYVYLLEAAGETVSRKLIVLK